MSDEVEIRSRAELRNWLKRHHDREDGVWLIHHKKVSPFYVPFGDLVAELLCWGWVDSVPRKVDATRTAHRIAPRDPGSAWSAVNKRKVEDARRSGAMTPAGEAAIARAKANGMWSYLDDVERLEVPDDLAAALGDLRVVWDDYPPSARRGTLEWLKTAKRPPTRARRIDGIVGNARAGLRPPPLAR